MAKKQLIGCLPPKFAKDLRKRLNKREGANVSNDEVLEYMAWRGKDLAGEVEKAKLSAIAYAKNFKKIRDYKRPATKAERKDPTVEVDKDGNVSDPTAGLKALVYRDRRELFGDVSLEAKQYDVEARAHAMLREMITKFAPKIAGIKRYKKDQIDMVRAIFGDRDIPQNYKEMGAAWREVNDYLIERYNKTGGSIERADIPLPMNTDYALAKEMGEKEWMEFVVPLLDLEAMDLGTISAWNGKPLKDHYQDIVTDGMHSRAIEAKLSDDPVHKKYFTQHFLKFKDSDSYLKYKEALSPKQTPYAAMMDQVTLLAREVGIRETLGPHPSSTFRSLRNTVVNMTGDKNAGDFAQKAYDNIAGNLTPVNQKLADSFQMARNATSGWKLTSAALSAIPDVVFNSMTAYYNGLSITGTMGKFLKTLSHNNVKDQQFAARLGFALEHAIDSIRHMSRFGEVAGRGIFSQFADSVMRGTGLNHWTVAGKQAFHMQFLQDMVADVRNNKRMMKSFKRYGITEEDIKIMEAADTITNHRGATFFDPYAVPESLSTKIIGMIKSETGLAVPEPDAAVMAMMNQGSRRGEWGGEVLRTGTQFKAFPVSIIMGQMARAFRFGFEGNVQSKFAYSGAMITSTTFLGMLSIQLKEIAKGEEPRPIGPSLLKDAIVAGGATSIIGDIILNDVDGYGQTFADFAAGPMVGELNRIAWKGLGNMQDVATGDKELTEVMGRTASAAANFIPGQLWWNRMVFDRLLDDYWRKTVDPTWQKRELQKERRQRRRQAEERNERWFK